VNRRRLRPVHSENALKAIYARPHDHRKWRDHHLRVSLTTEIAHWMADGPIRSAADLSCGNGAIVDALDVSGSTYKGDFAPGHPLTGHLEETLPQIPRVDLFVLSETLEHLDNPDRVLEMVREKADTLVLSTPVDCWDDSNEEHYWAWSREAVEEMLREAGWEPEVYATCDLRPKLSPYCFGIWGCR
jgi:hypothetical protein